MTLADQRKANDELRCTFKGGRVLMTPEVRRLDPQLRGRMLDRLTRYDRFDEESDHSYGMFVFAAYTFVWSIEQFAGERTLTVYLREDLLTSKREITKQDSLHQPPE